jgi:hypothetical protein
VHNSGCFFVGDAGQRLAGGTRLGWTARTDKEDDMIRHKARALVVAVVVDPLAYDAIMELAQREAINPKDPHHIMVAHEAIHLVSEQMGVAFLTKASALLIHAEGVVFRPLADESLWFETCVVLRAEDCSRLENEFARSFLRRHQPPSLNRHQP